MKSKARMTKTKRRYPETRIPSFGFCHSFVIRHSSFRANARSRRNGQPWLALFAVQHRAVFLVAFQTKPRCGRDDTFDRAEFRSEEHTSELQSRRDLVCRLLLEKKKKKIKILSLRLI